MANPTPLYQGTLMLFVDDKSHAEIQVSYTNRWSIVLNLHKYWKELKNRQKRASQYAKQREQVQPLKQPGPKYS